MDGEVPTVEPAVRLAPAFLAFALLAAPGLARAGVHMHMPHPHRHAHGPAPAADTPKSDVPDAIWTNNRTGR